MILDFDTRRELICVTNQQSKIRKHWFLRKMKVARQIFSLTTTGIKKVHRGIQMCEISKFLEKSW